jgi:DNA-binding NarL/FixJ family response regulator
MSAILKNTNPIFIIEDNEMYARTLQTFIQARFPEIKEVKTFRIGELSLMELHRNPSVIVVDYFLNSKYEEAHNGLEIIRRIKAEKPLTHIIVLSAQEKFDVILEAIKKYDCSYVQKDKDAFQHVEKLIREFISQKTVHAMDPWA